MPGTSFIVLLLSQLQSYPIKECVLVTTVTHSELKDRFSLILPDGSGGIVEDFNQDGKKEILMAGNFLYSDTETGEMDANNGTPLIQNVDGTFSYMPNTEHGFWTQGDVRELKAITLAIGEQAKLTGNNRGPVQIHIIKKTSGHEE